MTDEEICAEDFAADDLDVWSSGFVNRWHTFPDPRLRNAQDTTGAHSARVALLVFRLFQHKGMDDMTMLQNVLVALLHDAHEVLTGDIPYTAKRADASLAAKEKQLGNEWVERRGIIPFEMTPQVKLCDRLDAWLFANDNAPDILESYSWVHMQMDILHDAEALGVRKEVETMMAVAQKLERF